MASAKPPTADWYKQNMPSQIAEGQSAQLGISKDQLYQMYSTYANQFPGKDWTWQNQYTYQNTPTASQPYAQTQQVAPPGALSWIQEQVNTQKAQQVLNPQQQAQQAAPQWQMPQMAAAQPTPTVSTTPLTAAAQYGAATQAAGAPNLNVPQANAGAAAPLFSLGGGAGQNWMLPQAQTQQPQRFQSGGQVQSSNQQAPGGNYQIGDPNVGWYDPLYSGSALGAWALGQPLIVSPTPSGTPSSKSGVADVGQATVYGQPAYTGGPITLPSGKTFTAEQVAGFSPADWAEVGKVGIQRPMPSSISGGPWMQVPSVFNKAPMPTVGQAAGWSGNPQMPLTAQTPANAAQMPQMPITPAASAGAAQPQMTLASGYPMPAMGVAGRPMPPGAPGMPPGQMPAAPGATPPQMQGGPPMSFMEAHTNALANAGRALFAHFGGDPNSASPGDIANFHTQLTGMLGQLPQGRTTAAAGANVALATGSSGGPQKMQGGGLVRDPDPDAPYLTAGQQQPRRIAVPQQGQQPTQVQQVQQGQPADAPAVTGSSGAAGIYSQAQQLAMMRARMTMNQNAALSANTPAYPSATTPAAQGYAAAANAGQITGGAPTSAELSKAAAMTPGQIQGSIAQANMPMAGMAAGIGAIGSGIAQAMQTYANSIKPWRMQASAIPTPPPAPAPPRLAQEQVEQPQQGRQTNPYLAAMYGYPYV